MFKDIEAAAILNFHDSAFSIPGWPTEAPSDATPSPLRWIVVNHRYNSLLWAEEDKARRTDVGPEEIAASKRLIDQYNQKRNDAVESLDEAILWTLRDVSPIQGARLHSETTGAMIDRLSILALKIYHMREQTRRKDVGQEHISVCAGKLERLNMQRQDLAFCLDQLLAEVREGKAYFKLYRQFKMYNDPNLNPYLYGQNQAGGTRTMAS